MDISNDSAFTATIKWRVSSHYVLVEKDSEKDRTGIIWKTPK
jgi:hypothetical protein